MKILKLSQIDKAARQHALSVKFAQDFGGYFTGSVPQHGSRFLGTSAVDAGQITAMFGKAPQAIQLVNEFSHGELLKNVSFIFNFAKSGAYGVYVSELDRAMKVDALKDELQKKGYQVSMTEQGLTAFPKNGTEMTEDAIQQDIDATWKALEAGGGMALGVNMNTELQTAKRNATKSGSKDPEAWQWMALLNIGGTIVHEAIHAKGSRSEGPSEEGQQAFVQWALPKINEEYRKSMESQGKGDQFQPLMVTGEMQHASSNTWYKTAQLSYYFPQAFTENPIGSDLQGRFPFGLQSETGISPWSMMAQESQGIPIEKRLGRQYMSPIPPDLNQEHDSIEEQLRKYTRQDRKLDPKATMNELLSEGWDADRGYTTTEGLLDEKRPKPLLIPLQKKASKITKIATLFGWMNNLSISDGSTIPGLGDRVMAWEDRDESFSQEESWIKEQPRYNPTYDLKGFFFRWIEPRNQPQTFEDMTRDDTNTHPAKRFAASTSVRVAPEIANILSILAKAKDKIAKGQIASTRFIATDDVMPLIERSFPDNSFKVNVFHYGSTDAKEEIYAVWVSSPKVSEESIERVEKHLQHKTIDKDVDNLLETLTGLSKQRSTALQEVVSIVRDVCQSYNIKDFSIVGSYPRDVAMKSSLYLVDSLEFRGEHMDQCLKIGSLVAEKLGAKDVNVSHDNLAFNYKNISVSFSGDMTPPEIKAGLEEQGIDVADEHADLFNRDFTINMLAYDIVSNKITDPTGKAAEDIKNKTIRTLLDPNYVCQKNPVVILRALKLKIRHNMTIDPLLQQAMIKNINLLFDGRYSERDLFIARENVKKEGKREAEEAFKEFGLEKLDTIS